MAHRAEEKERRRRERIARRRRHAGAAARKRTPAGSAAARCWAWPSSRLIAIVALAGGNGNSDDGRHDEARRRHAKAAGCTFSQFKSEGRSHREQGHLQDQPAHVGQPQPDAGAGRDLPRGQLAAQGELRPHPRARAHRVPVQARHPGGRRRQAAPAGRGAAQRHRRIPRATLREQHGHAGPVRRDAWTVDPCPTLTAVAQPCASSAGVHGQGPRVHPLAVEGGTRGTAACAGVVTHRSLFAGGTSASWPSSPASSSARSPR